MDHRGASDVQHEARSAAGEVLSQEGRGNGYVLTYGGERIYIAGDNHYRGSDLAILEKALAGSGIEVRLRDWYGN